MCMIGLVYCIVYYFVYLRGLLNVSFIGVTYVLSTYMSFYARLLCFVLSKEATTICRAMHLQLQTFASSEGARKCIWHPSKPQEGRWRQDPELQEASMPHTTNSSTQAKELRDKLCQYFNSDIGAVPFQQGKIQYYMYAEYRKSVKVYYSIVH